jgi:subtilisin family serine protease
MKTTTLLTLLLLLLACAGCGGGSSPMLPDESEHDDEPAPPAGTSSEWVLVEPQSDEDIEEIAEELGATVLGPVPGTPYYRVSVPAGMSMMQFVHRLEGDARVVGSDPDLGLSSPEGDGSTLPAGGLLLASMIPVQPEVLRIGGDAARLRATGRDVRVAVLDTGILPHEFLEGHVLPEGWDFVDGDSDPLDEPDGQDNDGDGLVDEGHGHGTFVASLVLAVAPDAMILPFRVLDSDAIGSSSTLAAAITLAADRGAHVINLSVSMDDRTKVIQDAVQSARARGVYVIASAGNTGVDDVNFPSAFSQAFSVTAVDAFDVRATFASYGSEIDLSAPGVDLLGAYPSETGTARWSGTSFSAALVSGAYALLRELDPAAEPQDLLKRLEDTSVPLEPSNPEIGGELGEGRIDVGAATAP